MKNVLHFCESSETGGAENVLISIVERLDKSRYRSTVCLLSDGWLRDQLERRHIDTVVIPQPRSFDLGWLRRALRMMHEKKTDVMHSHEFATNAYAAMLSRVSGIPFVATVHGKNYYADRWRRRMAYRYAARRGTMVAVSQNLKQFLVQQVGISEERLRVVHNGIDVERYRPEQAADGIREQLGLRADQAVIGTIGNLFAVKGQVYLLRAMKSILQAVPGAMLLMAGEGDQLPVLQQEAANLGIADHVRFLGFRDDVPHLLRTYDVFVLPSLSEGLPLSVLEALALERPVVATRVGGVGEIIEDGVNGYLVAPGDPDALASRVIQVLNARDHARALGKVGRARVVRDFSLEQMIGNYERLYEM